MSGRAAVTAGKGREATGARLRVRPKKKKKKKELDYLFFTIVRIASVDSSKLLCPVASPWSCASFTERSWAPQSTQRRESAMAERATGLFVRSIV